MERVVSSEISIVILNGGGSRRMGTDKARIILDPLESLSMIDRVLQIASSLSNDVLLVGGDRVPSARTEHHVADLYPNEGPLGGLVTGLGVMRHERCLLLACDMPFVSRELVRQMVAVDESLDVMAQSRQSRIEPFHAIYHRRCLASAIALLAEGERSLQRLLATLDCHLVPEAIVDAVDPLQWSSFNVNTPADLDVARRHAAELRDAEDRPEAGRCLAL